MSTMATRYTQTVDWLSTLRWWLPQPAPLTQSPEPEQAQQFERAFHGAYRRFACRYPQWVSRRFDDEFLRQAMAATGTGAGHTTTALVARLSGYQLAWAWDRQFGALAPDHVRTRQVVELIEVANTFLQLWHAEHKK